MLERTLSQEDAKLTPWREERLGSNTGGRTEEHWSEGDEDERTNAAPFKPCCVLNKQMPNPKLVSSIGPDPFSFFSEAQVNVLQLIIYLLLT